jgi:hypothetical protein
MAQEDRNGKLCGSPSFPEQSGLYALLSPRLLPLTCQHTVNPQGLPSLSTCLNSSLLGSMSHCRIPVFPAAHHTSESDTLCGGDLDPHTLLSSCVTDNPTPATFFLALKFSPPCAIFSVYSS